MLVSSRFGEFGRVEISPASGVLMMLRVGRTSSRTILSCWEASKEIGPGVPLAWEDGSMMEAMDSECWGGVREMNCVEV